MTNQIINFELKIRPRGGQNRRFQKPRFQCRAGTSEEYASSSCLVRQIGSRGHSRVVIGCNLDIFACGFHRTFVLMFAI
jgi:hypothetical protein